MSLNDLPASVPTAAPSAASPAPLARQDRVLLAVQQWAFLAVALLLAGVLAERLRPAQAFGRDIVDTPFLWAIAVWLVVLIAHGAIFRTPQLQLLLRAPLVAATALAGVLFLVGLIAFDGGGAARRVLYLLANSAGAFAFWWGVFGLLAFAVRYVNQASLS